jgi:integrase
MGVNLRKRGKIYHLDLHHFGRRIRKTLKIKELSQAKYVQAEFAHSLLGGIWSVGLSIDIPLERAIAKYEEDYERDHHAVSSRSHTRLTFKRFLEAAQSWYGNKATLDTIRPERIEAFQRALLTLKVPGKKPIHAPSVNRAVRELSGLFNWAIRRGLCRLNPCAKVKALKEVRRLAEPASLKDLRKLVRVLPETYADLVRVILHTGLRLGEALHLRREDVSFESGLLYVRSRPDYQIKDREERAIRLTRQAARLLRRRFKSTPRQSLLLFPSEINSVIDNRNALRILHGGCKKTGIPRYNWKLLRKTFSTLQGKRLSPWELKAVLGHSDIRTSDKHYMLLAAKECRLRSIVI